MKRQHNVFTTRGQRVLQPDDTPVMSQSNCGQGLVISVIDP